MQRLQLIEPRRRIDGRRGAIHRASAGEGGDRQEGKQQFERCDSHGDLPLSVIAAVRRPSPLLIASRKRHRYWPDGLRRLSISARPALRALPKSRRPARAASLWARRNTPRRNIFWAKTALRVQTSSRDCADRLLPHQLDLHPFVPLPLAANPRDPDRADLTDVRHVRTAARLQVDAGNFQ